MSTELMEAAATAFQDLQSQIGPSQILISTSPYVLTASRFGPAATIILNSPEHITASDLDAVKAAFHVPAAAAWNINSLPWMRTTYQAHLTFTLPQTV